jgi:hypothetical protein
VARANNQRDSIKPMSSYSTPNLILAAAIAWALWTPSRADTITLNDGGVTDLQVAVRDTSVSFANQIEDLFPPSLPFDGSNIAIQGASQGEATFHLGQDGFAISSSGARPGFIDSLANVQPVIFFSVSVDTLYTITGNLSVDDPGASGKYVALTTTLEDLTTPAVLFSSDQESFGVVDQSFALGGTAGNVANSLSGSAAGLLLAGHQYKLFYGASIYAANDGDPASFIGSFDLELNAQNAAYEWSGVLQPINADGASVFKLGRSVPVKFQLTGASAGITTAVARLSYAKINDNEPGPVNEADSTSAATAGNLFRYDMSSQQYIFNWSTTDLSPGSYQLAIDLGDGVTHTVRLALR